MVSQLRQDNAELRHILKHGGNAGSAPTANFSALNSSTLQHTTQANSELTAANAKLRKQVESLKKELQEASQNHERHRTESARELARWKLKIGSSGGAGLHDSPGSFRGGNSPGGDANSSKVIADLRRQLHATQTELRSERLSRGANASSRSWTRPDVSSWSTNKSTYNRSYSAEGTRRSSSTGSAGSRTTTSPTTGRRVTLTASPKAGWNSTDRNNTRPGSGIAGRSVSPSVNRPVPRSREVSPSLRPRGSNGTPQSANSYSYANNNSPARRGSPAGALSSTLGGRYDPTAWAKQKALKEQNLKQGRAWGAGGTTSPAAGVKYRYQSPSAGESGYASANSQVRKLLRLLPTIMFQFLMVNFWLMLCCYY